MLVYGFGNWYLILPPFIAAAVIFFASGVNESLKVILGTIYMIMFVLTFLAYVTLEILTIPIPHKMPLHQRTTELEVNNGSNNFRIVAYIDPETKMNRTASFYIERTDLDVSMWNMTAQRVYGSVSAGAAVQYDRVISEEIEFELKWINSNILSLDGRHIEIDKDGQIVVVDHEDDDLLIPGRTSETTERPTPTRRPTPSREPEPPTS
jgi:hypothetical protein